jgi:hypothetical protein
MRLVEIAREHLPEAPLCNAQATHVCQDIRFDFGRDGRVDSGVWKGCESIGLGAGSRFERFGDRQQP